MELSKEIGLLITINTDGDFYITSDDNPVKSTFVIIAKDKKELKAKFTKYVNSLKFDSSKSYMFDTMVTIKGDLLNIADQKDIYKWECYEYGNQSLTISVIDII